jgi:glycosyltransferase involved in cell wall biosynthesis
VLLPSLRRSIGAHDVRALASLRRLIRSERPEILHTHTAKAGTLGRLAALLVARRDRPRVSVHTFHGHVLSGYFGGWQSLVIRSVERWLSARTTRLIAVSQEVADDLVQAGVASRDQVAVIPLGFDLGPFALSERAARDLRMTMRARLGIAPDDRVVVIVARLVPIKRIDRFLRIAERLSGVPKLRFLVVGDGELCGGLRSWASTHSLGERMVWAGIQRDMPAIYSASDVVVLTSDNEGTPVSLIEAQAAGLPVVATDVGGVRSVVDEGETGILIDPDDEAGFAEAISSLLEDPARARRLGARGRERVDRFRLDRLLDDIDGLYRSLLEKPDGRLPSPPPPALVGE